MPCFYSLILSACSTATVLIYSHSSSSSFLFLLPPFFFIPRPINKHKGQRDRHPPVPGQQQRERDSLTWRLVAGVADTQLLMKQKRSQISRGGVEAGNREERLKAVFLTAVACSRQHQDPALFLLLANSHSVRTRFQSCSGAAAVLFKLSQVEAQKRDQRREQSDMLPIVPRPHNDSLFTLRSFIYRLTQEHAHTRTQTHTLTLINSPHHSPLCPMFPDTLLSSHLPPSLAEPLLPHHSISISSSCLFHSSVSCAGLSLFVIRLSKAVMEGLAPPCWPAHRSGEKSLVDAADATSWMEGGGWM